jgi:hypothetical protein
MEQRWTFENAARAIAERFIKNGKGMPVRRVEIHVEGDSQLLGRLEQELIVWRLSTEYFPRFSAMNYVDDELREYAERCTEMVMQALKWMYRTESPSFNFVAIRSAIKSAVDSTAEDEMISVGMLFARDFLKVIAGWNGVPGDNDFSVTPRAEILGFQSIQIAWKEESERRNSEHQARIGATLGQEGGLVFLSHAAADQEIAAVLKKTIEEAIPGSDVFVSSDSEDLRPGDAWVEKIQSKLRQARIVVILSTERGVSRRWVWYETGAGWIRGIRVIPCCVGNLRKGQLMPPFHGFQALNGDEAKDLELLLKEVAGELGRTFKRLELSSVITKLKELDYEASLMQPESVSFEERRMRMQAIELTAYIDQGYPQLFRVLLTNRSEELVVIRAIQLQSLEGVLLTSPAEPTKNGQWKIEPKGKCPIEWTPNRNPAGELTGIERRKKSVSTSFDTEMRIKLHCESLGLQMWKECPAIRVQVDVLNNRIDQIGV